MRKIHSEDEVKYTKKQWKEHRQRMSLKVKHSTLFTTGFGMFPPHASEEEEHTDAESNAEVIEVIDGDAVAH